MEPLRREWDRLMGRETPGRCCPTLNPSILSCTDAMAEKHKFKLYTLIAFAKTTQLQLLRMLL